MSQEKAALVIAFDEIEGVRAQVGALAQQAVTLPVLKEHVQGLPELKQVVVDIQSRRDKTVTLAKGKSHIDKDGHLILVYTDGFKEDVGDVRPTMMIRHTAPHIPAGGGNSVAVTRPTVINVTADYSVVAYDGSTLLLVDATAGPITITLLPVAQAREVTIKRVNVNENAVTVSAHMGELVDGVASIDITQGILGNMYAVELSPTANGWWIT